VVAVTECKVEEGRELREREPREPREERQNRQCAVKERETKLLGLI